MALSTASVKGFHPETEIVCVSDAETKMLLDRAASGLLKQIDTWVGCRDITGNPQLKSRMTHPRAPHSAATPQEKVSAPDRPYDAPSGQVEAP